MTGATSINAAGQIVGYVYPATDNSFGFLRQTDGTIVVFLGDCFGPTASADVFTPQALGNSLFWFEGTIPSAINDRGQIAGGCAEAIGITWSFLRQPDGAITVFEPKHTPNPQSRALGINLSGQITGVFLDVEVGIYRGYLREPDGTIITFNASSLGTTPTAINSKGEITGYAGNDGFLRQPDGSIELFDAPNSTSTQPTAIDRKGQIVGSYLDASGANHGFLRRKNGSLVTLDVPNATNTNPTDINQRGTITGSYSDGTGVHGFVLYTLPTCKEQCKNSGWMNFGFKNQGQCIQFVNTGK
jgi:uncharacterized membrane protein